MHTDSKLPNSHMILCKGAYMAAMLRAVEPNVLKVHGQQPFLLTTLGSSRRIPSVGYRRRRRVMAALSLRDGIAEFYDQSSGAWEQVWGDHMHHGFYDPGASASVSYHRSAQIRMIDEALKFAAVSGPPLRLLLI